MPPIKHVPQALTNRIKENEQKLYGQEGSISAPNPVAPVPPTAPKIPKVETPSFEHRLKQALQKPAEITEQDRERADAWGVSPDEISGFKKDILNTVAGALSPSNEEYYTRLAALGYAPEVRGTIVNDPKFAEFLAMNDGNTGRPIRTIAVEADAARDATTMAEVYAAFTQWKNSAAGSGQGTNQKTRAEYDAFLARHRTGYYSAIGKSPEEAKKRADEFKRLSDEFETARRQGRF